MHCLTNPFYSVEKNQIADLPSFHRGVAQLASASALGADDQPRIPFQFIHSKSLSFKAFARLLPWALGVPRDRKRATKFSSNSGASRGRGIKGLNPHIEFPILDGPGIPTRIGMSGFLFSVETGLEIQTTLTGDVVVGSQCGECERPVPWELTARLFVEADAVGKGCFVRVERPGKRLRADRKLGVGLKTR